MKQEIVIKVTVNGPKSRSKALQTAVGLPGEQNLPRTQVLELQYQIETMHLWTNSDDQFVDRFCDSVGVESAGLGGQDKSQIEVVGDGVDAVELVNLLRKKVGYAELASVAAVAEKKEANESVAQPVVWPMYGGGMPQTYIYPIHPTNYY
ncbi:hypothetical protein OIU84_016837 [Salix udensis]|uniref:Uncharacterized protein n=1 Tax=Salix udensis TaxID=889485 RepID=A0AAD6NQS0_9ROSI|nr:hypothetical protein OIU84_016837 [Salix udensis]